MTGGFPKVRLCAAGNYRTSVPLNEGRLLLQAANPLRETNKTVRLLDIRLGQQLLGETATHEQSVHGDRLA